MEAHPPHAGLIEHIPKSPESRFPVRDSWGLRVLLLAVSLVATWAYGSDEAVPLLTAGVCDRPPVLDGRIADKAWRTAAGGSHFPVRPNAGFARVCHDATNLYIAAVNVRPQVEAMNLPDAERDADIENQENVEIFLAPRPTTGMYFHFVISAANVQKDQRCSEGKCDVSWNGTWRSAVQVIHKSWGVEIAIPFETLGEAQPGEGDLWAFNIRRRAQGIDGSHLVSWSPAARDGKGHDRCAFGRLRFTRQTQATVVGHIAEEFPGRNECDVMLQGIDRGLFTVNAGTKDEPVDRFQQWLTPGNTRLLYELHEGDGPLSVTLRDEAGTTIWASGSVPSPALDAWPPFTERIEGRAFEDRTDRLLDNGPREEDGKPAYGLAVATSMLKVLPKKPAEYTGGLATSIHLSAARNEVEAAQIVLYSPERALTRVQLECSALGGDEGGVIDSASILAAPVGYVKTEEPVAHPMPHVGWWPDPILSYLPHFDVQKGDLASVWYSVRVPEGTAPGTYKGTLTIRPADAPAASVPVTLTVWDFALPRVPSLKTAIGHSVVNLHHKEESREHIEQVLEPIYEKFLIDHRTTPSHMYRPRPPSEAQLRRWRDWGVASFCITYISNERLLRDDAGRANGLDPDDENQYHAQIAESLQLARDLGIGDKAYVYLFDERVWPDFAGIQKVAARLAERFPEVRTLTTCDDRTFGEQLPSINAFCPLTIYYDRPSADDARARGKEVWWYVYVAPHMPHANVNLEQSAIATRLLLGFMSFAYQVDGFLYYGMSRLKLNEKTLRGGPYTDWIPRSWGRYNCDGHLYYPTPDGPVSSIRFENWLDGLEDYEYLALLSRRLEERTGNDDLTRAAREVLMRYTQPGNEIVRTMTGFTHDPADVSRARAKLAGLILRLGSE